MSGKGGTARVMVTSWIKTALALWVTAIGLCLALAGLGIALVKLARMALHPDAPGAHLVTPMAIILGGLVLALALLLALHAMPSRRRRPLRNGLEALLVLGLAGAAMVAVAMALPQSRAIVLQFDGKTYQIPREYHPIAYPERGLILGLCGTTLAPEYAAPGCSSFVEMRFNRLALLDDPALSSCVAAGGGRISAGRLVTPGEEAVAIGLNALRYQCKDPGEELYLHRAEAPDEVLAYTRLSGNGVVQHGLRLGGMALHFPAQPDAEPATEAQRWMALLDSWQCPAEGCPAQTDYSLGELLFRE